jgi:hypothetical protein
MHHQRWTADSGQQYALGSRLCDGSVAPIAAICTVSIERRQSVMQIAAIHATIALMVEVETGSYRGAETAHPLYSITSSARARTESGIVRPSAFDVFRLMINSILSAR